MNLESIGSAVDLALMRKITMGNFAILRVEKVKTMSGMAARGRHNFREQDTPNADGDRLGLNAIEGAKSTDELLKAVSNLLPQKRRKNAVIGLEYLITASPEHFGDWRKSENHGQDYFADAIRWLEEKHGKENVVCKTVHLDESTPHLAAFVVPLKDEKLNAKAFTGGAKVLAQMQTSFAAEVGAKHGLERGVERSKAVHQENAKIQPMTIERMQLRKQVKALSDEVERLTKSVSSGAEALVKTQAHLANEQSARERLMRFSMDDVRKIGELKQENESMKKELITATERDHELVAEISALRAENKNARATIEQLQAVDRVLVDQARAQMFSEAHKNDVEVDVQKLLETWKAVPASEGRVSAGTTGIVKAVEGRYVVQYIGMDTHVMQKLADGVKAPSVGSMATIKGGQVVSVKVQERGGLSR